MLSAYVSRLRKRTARSERRNASLSPSAAGTRERERPASQSRLRVPGPAVRPCRGSCPASPPLRCSASRSPTAGCCPPRPALRWERWRCSAAAWQPAARGFAGRPPSWSRPRPERWGSANASRRPPARARRSLSSARSRERFERSPGADLVPGRPRRRRRGRPGRSAGPRAGSPVRRDPHPRAFPPSSGGSPARGFARGFGCASRASCAIRARAPGCGISSAAASARRGGWCTRRCTSACRSARVRAPWPAARAPGRVERSHGGGGRRGGTAARPRAGRSARASPAQRDAFARLGIAHILAVSGLHLALVASLFFAVARWTVGRSAALAARRDTRVFALAAGVAAAVIYAVLVRLGRPGPPRARAALRTRARGRVRASARAAPPLAAAAIAVLAFAAPGALPGRSAALLRRQSRARAWLAAVGHGAGVGSRLRDAARVGRAARFGERRRGDGAAGRAPPRPGGALRPGREPGRGSVDGLRPAPGRRSRPVGAVCRPDRSRTRSSGGPALPPAGPRSRPRRWRRGCRRRRRGAPATSGWAVVGVLVVRCFGAAADTHARAPRAGGDGRRRPRAATRWRPRPRASSPSTSARATPSWCRGATRRCLDRRRRRLPRQAATSGAPSSVRPSRRSASAASTLLAVSHADLDHRGGVPAVLGALPVAEVWLPDGAREDRGVRRPARRLRRGAVSRSETRAGATRRSSLGELLVEVLWPPPARATPAAPAGSSDNDRSLVLRVSAAGGARVLLPGDLEAAGEAGLLAAPGGLCGPTCSSSRTTAAAPRPARHSSAPRAPPSPSRRRPASAASRCRTPQCGARSAEPRESLLVDGPRRRRDGRSDGPLLVFGSADCRRRARPAPVRRPPGPGSRHHGPGGTGHHGSLDDGVDVALEAEASRSSSPLRCARLRLRGGEPERAEALARLSHPHQGQGDAPAARSSRAHPGARLPDGRRPAWVPATFVHEGEPYERPAAPARRSPRHWRGSKHSYRVKFKQRLFQGRKEINLIVPWDKHYAVEWLQTRMAEELGLLFLPGRSWTSTIDGERPASTTRASSPRASTSSATAGCRRRSSPSARTGPSLRQGLSTTSPSSCQGSATSPPVESIATDQAAGDLRRRTSRLRAQAARLPAGCSTSSLTEGSAEDVAERAGSTSTSRSSRASSPCRTSSERRTAWR